MKLCLVTSHPQLCYSISPHSYPENSPVSSHENSPDSSHEIYADSSHENYPDSSHENYPDSSHENYPDFLMRTILTLTTNKRILQLGSKVRFLLTFSVFNFYISAYETLCYCFLVDVAS